MRHFNSISFSIRTTIIFLQETENRLSAQFFVHNGIQYDTYRVTATPRTCLSFFCHAKRVERRRLSMAQICSLEISEKSCFVTMLKLIQMNTSWRCRIKMSSSDNAKEMKRIQFRCKNDLPGATSQSHWQHWQETLFLGSKLPIVLDTSSTHTFDSDYWILFRTTKKTWKIFSM